MSAACCSILPSWLVCSSKCYSNPASELVEYREAEHNTYKEPCLRLSSGSREARGPDQILKSRDSSLRATSLFYYNFFTNLLFHKPPRIRRISPVCRNGLGLGVRKSLSSYSPTQIVIIIIASTSTPAN